MSDKKKGFIYVLTNPSMPAWVKIGCATNVEERIKSLNSPSSVPLSFHVHLYLESDDIERDEKRIHSLIDTINPGLRSVETLDSGKNRKREFFKLSASHAAEIIKKIFCEIGPYKISRLHFPDQEKSPAVVKKGPAKHTTFAMLGVPVGAVLAFRKDPSVTCTVSDPVNQVTWKGQKYSISALAGELYHGRSVNGFDCFTWPDSDHPEESLVDRRLRLGL